MIRTIMGDKLQKRAIELVRMQRNKLHVFLAAMSSSRNYVVTNCVRLCMRRPYKCPKPRSFFSKPKWFQWWLKKVLRMFEV